MGPSPLQIVIVLAIVVLLFLAGRLVDRASAERARLAGGRRRRRLAPLATGVGGAVGPPSGTTRNQEAHGPDTAPDDEPFQP